MPARARGGTQGPHRSRRPGLRGTSEPEPVRPERFSELVGSRTSGRSTQPGPVRDGPGSSQPSFAERFGDRPHPQTNVWEGPGGSAVRDAFRRPQLGDPLDPEIRDRDLSPRTGTHQQQAWQPPDFNLETFAPEDLGGEPFPEPPQTQALERLNPVEHNPQMTRAPERAVEFVQRASEYTGIPYQWGGSSPEEGFDCSGLIWHVGRQMGVDLPRVSRDQARVGQEVPSLEQAMPGDLVAFPARGQEVGHIGIYVGGGQMLNAPRSGTNVRIDQIGDREIATIRRVFDGGAMSSFQTPGGGGHAGPTPQQVQQMQQAAAWRQEAQAQAEHDRLVMDMLNLMRRRF